MVMGDGYLGQNRFRNGTYGGNYQLDIVHGAKQVEYLEHKRNIVNEIFDYEIPIREKIAKAGNGKKYRVYKFVTHVHSRFTFIANRIYDENRKKHITPWVLDNITDEGMAYWWMDDGCLFQYDGTKKGRSGGFTILAVCCFPEGEVEMLRDWISNRYNVNLNINRHKSGLYLRRGLSEGYKLVDALKQYSVPCMDYKFQYSFKRKPYNLARDLTAPVNLLNQ